MCVPIYVCMWSVFFDMKERVLIGTEYSVSVCVCWGKLAGSGRVGWGEWGVGWGEWVGVGGGSKDVSCFLSYSNS